MNRAPRLALVALACYAGARLGTALPEASGGLPTVLPAAGVALFSVLAWGGGTWPAIALAALAAALGRGAPPLVALAVGGGSALAPLAAGFALRRLGFDRRFLGARDVFAFVGAGALACTSIDATVGTAALSSAGLLPAQGFGQTWLTWWLGDVLGVLIVCPALLAQLPSQSRGSEPQVMSRVEAVVAWGGLVGASLLVTSPLAPFGARLPPVLLLPFVIWFSLRGNLRHATCAVLLLAAVAAWGLATGTGPFIDDRGVVELARFRNNLLILPVVALLLASLRHELLAAGEMARRVHESMMDAFVMVDMSGRVIDCNQSFREMLGYADEELRALTYVDLTPGEWHEAEARIVAEQILPTGRSAVYEKEYARKDGTILPVELRTFLLRDKDGRPEAMWAIVRDISERKRVEERMQLSQQIFDSASEAIFVSDLQGNLLDVNPEACRLAKYTREEMLRLRNVDIVAKEDVARISPELDRCDAGEVAQDRWLLLCSDGSTVPLDLVVQRLPGDRYLAIGRDLTERDRYLRQLAEARDAAEAANRAKSRFLAAASHDLRQPAQAIDLLRSALSETALSEEQRKICDNLALSVGTLGDILNTLLDVSRLEAGSVRAVHQVVDLKRLFGAIEAEVSPLATEATTRLRFRMPARDVAVVSDPAILQIMMGNLIGNAIKYTERGGVLVAVRRRGARALVQVWDSGIGIAPEHVERIFDEYYQVANPERDKQKGLGLGLAIVKRLAALLGTDVVCRSRHGRGSVFEFGLPIASEEPPADTRGVASPEAGALRPALDGTRVVLIDDNSLVTEATRLAMGAHGVRVVTFASGEEALASAEIANADFYFCDYGLPGMNGVQVLDAIRLRSEAPVRGALLTGNTAPDQVETMAGSGWPILYKPVRIGDLMDAIAGKIEA